MIAIIRDCALPAFSVYESFDILNRVGLAGVGVCMSY